MTVGLRSVYSVDACPFSGHIALQVCPVGPCSPQVASAKSNELSKWSHDARRCVDIMMHLTTAPGSCTPRSGLQMHAAQDLLAASSALRLEYCFRPAASARTCKNSRQMVDGNSKHVVQTCASSWPSSQASAVTPSGVSMQITPSCETS